MARNAVPIKDIAGALLGRLSGKRRAREDKIREAWRRAAGEKHGSHSEPISFRKKELVVNVESSSWLYELTMQKPEITAKLRRALKREISRIRFRIGPVEGQGGSDVEGEEGGKRERA